MARNLISGMDEPKQHDPAEDLHRARRTYSRAADSIRFKTKDDTFMDWLRGYLDTIALISGLGSQITFSIITSGLTDPATLDPANPGLKHGAVFGVEDVRTIVSLGWCVFTVAVGIAIFAKIVFIDPISARNLEKNLRSTMFKLQFGTVLFLLNLLPTVAFTLISLAVTAYVPIVGWVAVGCSGLATLVAFLMSTGLLGVGPSIPRLLRDF